MESYLGIPRIEIRKKKEIAPSLRGYLVVFVFDHWSPWMHRFNGCFAIGTRYLEMCALESSFYYRNPK
jgi:hypothetical protein